MAPYFQIYKMSAVLANCTILVCGGGLAGLTAAHELTEAGAKVVLVDAAPQLGGFVACCKYGRVTSEDSWRGWGPSFLNCFDVMQRIRTATGRRVYDELRPIKFSWENPPVTDLVSSLIVIFKSLVSGTHKNVREELWNKLTDEGRRFLMTLLGPCLGLNPYYAPLKEVFLFLLSQILHAKGSPVSGWKTLAGPIGSVWIDPWTDQLREMGVRICTSCAVEKFLLEDNRVQSAVLIDANGQSELRADAFILAVSPFDALEIARASGLETLSQDLKRITSCSQIQISLCLGWTEKIHMKKSIFTLSDSAYNLTVCAHTQVWSRAWRKRALTRRIKTLWTVTACVCEKVPGVLFGLPACRLSKAQFLKECMAQLENSTDLQRSLLRANNKYLEDFTLVFAEPWHDWKFSSMGVTSKKQRWAPDCRIPHSKLNVRSKGSPSNLVFAGAHTDTAVQLYNMESAVLSGKAAAIALGAGTVVIERTCRWWCWCRRMWMLALLLLAKLLLSHSVRRSSITAIF